MESTIAEDFLNDIAELDDEEIISKKQKIEEIEALEKSEILCSADLNNLLSSISDPSLNQSNKFVETCSKFSIEIEREITQLHKYLKDLFYPRFQELEDLVPSVIPFANLVIILLDDNFNPKQLELHIGTNVLIAISTALIRSPLQKIENTEQIRKLCNEILELDLCRNKLIQYIQTQMASLAPNLTSLVSCSVAANILCAAGSIEKLAFMPACNIQVLGLDKSNLPGMSNIKKFRSYLSFSPFVVSSGPLAKKAVRMLSGKVALVARIDLFHQYADGSKGLEMLNQLNTSLEKSLEVASNSQKKPLPVPKELKKPHRGGKRIRAAKKKYEMTEVRKEMNRVEFGINEQEEYRETGYTFGMLGKSGKTQTKISKNKLKLNAKTRNLLSSGTTSCFTFTNQSEVKLDNPYTSSSIQSKYFQSDTGFTTVLSTKVQGENK